MHMFMAWTRIRCSGNGRVLKFACRKHAKKAKNVGRTKAAKLNLRTKLSLLQQNTLFTFWRKDKVPVFGEERRGVAMNWKVRRF